MTRIIGICNQKGGVGKTTTAVNLSASLAALEKKTLLIDMDPQGNASQGLGFNTTLDEDIFEALTLAGSGENLSAQSFLHFLQKTEIPFLQLLPASPSLAALEIELVTEERREYRLATLLKNLAPEFDYVIIDTPPSLGLLTLNVLTAVDEVLIPIQCEYYALQGVAELFNTIRLVQKNLNSRLQILGAVPTMYDHRLSLARQVVEDVQSTFAGRVFKTIIPRNVKLSEAPSFGKPVILYDIRSLGASKYMELAEELLQAGANNG